MPPELRKWQCGRCGYVVDLPDHEAEYDQFVAAMNRIREHRWAHLTDSLMSASDDDLVGMCEDRPADPCQSGYARRLASHELAGGQPTPPTPSEPVSQEDVDSCLVTVTGLLRDDLPRAKRLWYPINEDGSFNR